MGSPNSQSKTIALFTKDAELTNELTSSESNRFTVIDKPSEFDVSSDSIDQFAIVIYDVDHSEDTSESIQHILDIKRTDPAVVLFALGSVEKMSALLASPVQNIVYRAFNKPISKNQVSLAFGSALKEHERLNTLREQGEDISVFASGETDTPLDTLSESKSPKFAIIGVIAALIIVPLIYFLSSSDDNKNSNQNNQGAIQQADETQSQNNTVNDLNTTINQLNQQASEAILEGRLIGDKTSALSLFDQVLELDPYDATAYDGKKDIAKTLRDLFPSFLDANQFDEAISIIDALSKIDFLAYTDNPLDSQLNSAIQGYVQEVSTSGTKEEIAAASALLEKVDGIAVASQKALQAAEQEQQLLERISSALETNNLTPPKKDNAYSLISFAHKRNVVRDANLAGPTKELIDKMLVIAQQNIDQDKLDEANKVVALLANLNGSSQQIDKLKEQIAAKTPTEESDQIDTAKQVATASNNAPTQEPENQESDGADQNASNENAESQDQQDRIIPAKIISRVIPKYPKSAMRKGTQGYVTLAFSINSRGNVVNASVVDSSPASIFDQSALNAISQWKFSPARNERTSEAIDSQIDSLKLRFELN